MSIRVDKLIFRPLALRGLPPETREEINRELARLFRNNDQLRERTGGSTDTVAATSVTAGVAAATASATAAGVTVPAPGGAVTLTPENPLEYSASGQTRAYIVVLTHARTGAAAPLTGATMATTVARGDTYHVYYVDPTDLGGAVTYIAATDLTGFVAATHRYIGSIAIPAGSYPDRAIEP